MRPRRIMAFRDMLWVEEEAVVAAAMEVLEDKEVGSCGLVMVKTEAIKRVTENLDSKRRDKQSAFAPTRVRENLWGVVCLCALGPSDGFLNGKEMHIQTYCVSPQTSSFIPNDAPPTLFTQTNNGQNRFF